MIYLELFLGFLEVGLFSFGGAYGAIPLIRDVVLRYGWMDDQTLTRFIAVCESTPGPIMVNMATYIGSSQGGILGAGKGLSRTAALDLLVQLFVPFVILIQTEANARGGDTAQKQLQGNDAPLPRPKGRGPPIHLAATDENRRQKRQHHRAGVSQPTAKVQHEIVKRASHGEILLIRQTIRPQ